MFSTLQRIWLISQERGFRATRFGPEQHSPLPRRQPQRAIQHPRRRQLRATGACAACRAALRVIRRSEKGRRAHFVVATSLCASDVLARAARSGLHRQRVPAHQERVRHDLRAGVRGAERQAAGMGFHLDPWETDEYLRLYWHVRRLIIWLDLAVVVLYMSLRPALDATRDLSRRFVTLSPNTVADTITADQSWDRSLWKYPACVTTTY
ncbi:hypothetical protein F4680DRAFT_232903 [Xylaria scruposa]|nr:hypothetical protein F4680DRAFT_232903 [Xylaria scruposa]